MSPAQVRCAALALLAAGAGSGLAHAQPSTCQPSDACAPRCPAIEIEIGKPLHSETAVNLLTNHPSAAWKPLSDALRQIHAKAITRSIPEDLAVRTGVGNLWTVALPPGTSASALRSAVARLRSLSGPGSDLRILQAAPLPAARPPTMDADPWTGLDELNASAILPKCLTQSYLSQAKVDAAWSCNATGEGVTVAVVDWSFIKQHVDLAGAYFGDDDPAYKPYNSCDLKDLITENQYTYHGAGSVGLIAARKNAKGIQGIAYNSRVWPLQATCATSPQNPCDICGQVNPWATAVLTAVARKKPGPMVLLLEAQTCCDGNYESSVAVRVAIREAVFKSHIVVVVPAGNGSKNAGCDDQAQPFDPTGSIVVGAFDGTGSLIGNYGDRISVSAPGNPNLDLTCGEGFDKTFRCDGGTDASSAYTARYGGTSGASAKVAAVVALMLQKDPTLAPDDVLRMLVKAGKGQRVGTAEKPGGVALNAFEAVKLADPKHCVQE